MEVWTIQLGKWRIAQAQGLQVLNITRGSGIDAFAPDVDKLKAYRLGLMTPVEYRVHYVARMRRTFVQQRPEWDKLKQLQRVAVACYCPAGKFCHRHIFTELLQAFMQREGIPFELKGELI